MTIIPNPPDSDISVLANPDLEITFLSCLMLNLDLAPTYVGFPASGFYFEDNRKVWMAIEALHREGRRPDPTAVTATLIDRGMDSTKAMGLIKNILDFAMVYQPTIVEADAYFDLLKETYRKRRIDSFAQRIRSSIRYPGTGWKTAAQQEWADIFQDGQNTENPFVSIADIELLESANDCLSTGLADLDELLDGGIKRRELTLIGARTAMGKTAFSAWLAMAAALQNKNVSFVSVEMDQQAIFKRWLGAYGNYPYNSFRYATEEIKQTCYASLKAHGSKIRVNSKSKTPDSIIASLRREMMERPVDVIFIDHLHHIIAGDSNDRAMAGQFVTDLKNLAMETNTAIVLLAQLNRGVESQQDKRPKLSDIREFGATEQIVDLCLMLYRDEYYNPDTIDKSVTEISITKNRNGRTHPGLKVLSDLATNRYYNFSEQSQFVLSQRSRGSNV